MPIVQMPDGALVDLPEKLTDDERKQLEAILAQSEPGSGAGKVFGKRAALSVLPGVGGLAGAEAGAVAGAGLGAFTGPLAPVAVPTLGFLGALAGGVGGSMLTAKGQEKALEAMPETRAALGVDPETLAKEEEAHGTAAMLGSLAGQAVSMRPSATTLRQALGKGTAEEVARARALVGGGAGVGGGLTAAMQKLESPEEDLDWKSIAESTLAGALLTKPTKRVGEPISRRIRGLEREQPQPPPGKTEVDATTTPPLGGEEESVLRPPLEPSPPTAGGSSAVAELIRASRARAAAETPAVETPVAETPVAETPVAETPAVKTPAVETPAAETPAADNREKLNRPNFPVADDTSHTKAQQALAEGQYIVVEGFKQFRGTAADSVLHIFNTKDEALAAAGRMTRKTAEAPSYVDIIQPNGRIIKLDRVGKGQYREARARVGRAVEEALVKTETRRIENEFASYPENFARLDRGTQLKAFDAVKEGIDTPADRTAATEKLEGLGLKDPDIEWLFSRVEESREGLNTPMRDETTGSTGYESLADLEENVPLRGAPTERKAPELAEPAKQPQNVKELVDAYGEGRMSFDDFTRELESYGVKKDSQLFDEVKKFDPRNSKVSPKSNAPRIWEALKPFFEEKVTPVGKVTPAAKRPTLSLTPKTGPLTTTIGELTGLKPSQLKGKEEATPAGRTNTHTLESVVPALRNTFGIHTERLFNNGFFNVVQRVEDLPDQIKSRMEGSTAKAIYFPDLNKAFFIADRIPTPYNLKGLMLHEVGVHAGMETMLGTRAYENLLKEVSDRAARGEKPFKDASDRVPYKTPPENVPEERLAYLVSNYKDLPFVKRIYSQLRQWLYRKMGGRFITLSNDDINTMALASLRRVSDLAESGRTSELSRSEALKTRATQTAEREAATADAANRELAAIKEGFASDDQELSDAQRNKLDQESAERDERRKINRSTVTGRLRNWFADTKDQPLETQIRLFQDARRLLLNNDRRERAAGRLGEDQPGLHALATAAPSKLESLRTAPIQKNLVDAFQQYLERTKSSFETGLAQFNRWMHALTEPDLRKWLFIRYVPLKNEMVTLADGSKINPAEAREVVNKAYETNDDLTSSDARQKYGYNADDLRDYLNYLADNYAEPNGFTPEEAPPSIKSFLPDRSITDINHSAYDLTGVSQETAARWRREFEESLSGEYGPEIQAVLDAEKALREETVRLEKLNGHWGNHVDNAIGVMRRSNYYTLKGDANQYNYDVLSGTRLRGELGRVQGEMGGRTTMSDNPLTQTLADSNVALSRLDRKDFLDELYRQGKAGLLRDPRNRNTRVLKILDSIKVGERNAYELPPDVSPESIVLRPDNKGGYDVMQIVDDKWREAIKGIVTTQNLGMSTLAQLTRGIASVATRWNPAFGPANAIRDLSTNMSTIGAEYGYKTGLQVGVRFFVEAAKGSAYKAAKVANLIAKNDIATLEKLADKDPFVKNLYDWMKEGGSTAYNTAFSNETATVQLINDIKNKGIVGASKETLSNIADVFNNMFEYMNREAAYSTLRNKFREDGARTPNKRAALETLNLMNPALSGIYTKSLSSWFAFFRASATGAVRQIDSILAPLTMTPEEWVRKTYGAKYQIDTNTPIERVLRNPQERQKALEYWEQRRKNAYLMAITSLGFGYAMREMSKVLSDENEKGENRVATDNSALWTRSLRIPTTILGPYKDALGSDIHFLSIPWGYGAGSFAAMGAQLSGMTSGDIKPFEAARNIVGVSKDSFLPIPTEDWSLFNRNPVGAAISSAAPTPLKPAIYFALNADYYGRQIYNSKFGRYADAYSGGDYVPEDFKALSKALYEASDGEYDIAPQSFQFFANSYFSGIANLTQAATGSIRTLAGQKEFTPKTDIPGISSFLGAESDADARKFSDTETDIRRIKTKLSTFENTRNYTAYQKFINQHPEAPGLVKHYDTVKNRINQITKLLNDIRAADISIQERKQRVDELRKMRSLYLKDLNDTYEAYKDRS